MEYSSMQQLKRDMFARRNGIIADTLRKAGSKFKIIFGLQLTELMQVAANITPDKDFAEKVWQNSTTRESMLIAPMLMPRNEFSIDDANRWIAQVPEIEVADILCFKLLKYQAYAFDLASSLLDNDADIIRYTALRLLTNLASGNEDELRIAATNELQRQSPITKPLAQFVLQNY